MRITSHCRTKYPLQNSMTGLHFDEFTLAMVVGIRVGDTTLRTTIANLGWGEVRFSKPVFHGDTNRVETEALALRESRSSADAAIVRFLHRAGHQQSELIGSCKRSGLQQKPAVRSAALGG